jgi:hypothetical protein
LERVRDAVVTAPFSVVWREMQRQHNAHPQLLAAFHAVPEALDW